ncbi:MAG TPA: hypothetical protein VLQ92_12010 [Candidatus Limnocylindrales bacterium]|nr:hypothetical protein [Candidatus Limnocylindrales bacterium]
MSAAIEELRATDPGAEPTDAGPDVAASLTRTLARFGASSVAVGGLLALTSSSPTGRAFGQQTAAWGAINTAIAGFGAWRSRTRPAKAAGLRRTLLVNAGLDVAYMAAGAHLAHHRSTLDGRVTADAARGHGLAVVVQGLGLMVLDLTYARRLG